MKAVLIVVGVLWLAAYFFSGEMSYLVASQVWLAASAVNSIKDD